jgi:hypothetical protein
MSAWDHGLAYTLIAAQILLAVLECIARPTGLLRARCIKGGSWSSRLSRLGPRSNQGPARAGGFRDKSGVKATDLSA